MSTVVDSALRVNSLGVELFYNNFGDQRVYLNLISS